MQDEQYKGQPDGDEQNDPFKSFIDDELFSDEADGQRDLFRAFVEGELMDDSSDEEPVKNEYDAIRRVLEKLEKEYDVRFEVHMSDNLNSRLEGVNAIFYFPDDVSIELQRNNLSEDQLRVIEERLTSERTVMRASEDELKRMMEAVGDLMSYVEVDPEQVFLGNQSKKFALLRVLLSSFQYIEGALSTKADRDREQISAREYLQTEALMSVQGLRDVIQKYSSENPLLDSQKDEAVSRIQSLVEIIQRVDQSAQMSRQYLRRIDDLIHQSVRISMGWETGMKFAFDDQAQEDARIMLEELAQDYPAQ